jgi:hypothetical protein
VTKHHFSGKYVIKSFGYFLVMHVNLHLIILSLDGVTIDEVWNGNRIYWTLATRNYR